MPSITTPEQSEAALELFKKAMEPIWPNLTKKQTSLDFITKWSFKKDQEFMRRIFNPR